MKTTILSIALLIFSMSIVRAQEDVSASKWQATQIVVDGNDDEWSKPFNFFDNASGLIFTVSNDSKNIYFCFSNNDKAKTGKMMAAGWSLELSSSEKKRKFAVTISFPKSADPNMSVRGDLKTSIGIYKTETQTIQAKGFLINNGDLLLVNKDGPVISIGSDNEQKIVYEIELPIKDLMEEDKVKLNELITFNITVNALTNPGGRPPAPVATGRGSYGGGGGRMGGRRMGGGNRASSPDANAGSRTAFYDKVSFKQKIRLVTK